MRQIGILKAKFGGCYNFIFEGAGFFFFEKVFEKKFDVLGAFL